MNQIFEKCRAKRHYNRKPLCKNMDGYCDFQTCRCNYAFDLRLVAEGKKPRAILAMLDNPNCKL